MKPLAYHRRWERHYVTAIARAIQRGTHWLRSRLEHELQLVRRRIRRIERKAARR